MIRYEKDSPLNVDDVIRVFKNSGIKRPVDDPARIQKMIDHANLTITAWDGEKLIGIARALTDFSFCCYLSDLAVEAEYQRQGIGRELIRQLRNQFTGEVKVMLNSAKTALDYYPKLGFIRADTFFYIPREK